MRFKLSLGLDPQGRADAVVAAVRGGYISADQGRSLLPSLDLVASDARALLENPDAGKNETATQGALAELARLRDGMVGAIAAHGPRVDESDPVVRAARQHAGVVRQRAEAQTAAEDAMEPGEDPDDGPADGPAE